MRVLAIDTATEALSAAVFDGSAVVGRYEVIGRGHAERLLPLVDELLATAGWTLGSLDGIGFGRGPGAFTGVRIAVSVAQGLGFGAGVPLVPVSDLAALGRLALDRAAEAGIAVAAALPCLDARMGEVYVASVRDGPAGALLLEDERLVRPELAGLRWPPAGAIVAAGHGWSAYPDLGANLGERLRLYLPELLPRAHEIARLAARELALGRGVAAELAEPVYLRNDVATRSHRTAPP